MIFTNVIKPTHICNLDCTYCYNEDARKPKMGPELLDRVVQQTLLYASTLQPQPGVDFIWHGGEPMVVGLDFFRHAVALEKAHNPGIAVNHTIQTNGTLISKDWAEFFVKNRFRVSVSIDGPKDLNDATRIHRNGKGAFDEIMRGIQILRNSGIPFGVCVVISKANKDKVDAIYDFLAREQLPFNVIPLNRSGSGLANYDDVGLEAEEYAKPWIEMFDRWLYAAPDSYVFASDFVHKSCAIMQGSPTDCIGQEVCSSHHISTDPEGFVYPCATLSGNAEWCYGNLMEQSLQKLMEAPLARSMTSREIDPHCARCKWKHVCHGGCISRSIKFFGTHNTRDYYCPSLYEIYEHVEARLRAEPGLDLRALPPQGSMDDREKPAPRALKERVLSSSGGLPLVRIGKSVNYGSDGAAYERR